MKMNSDTMPKADRDMIPLHKRIAMGEDMPELSGAAASDTRTKPGSAGNGQSGAKRKMAMNYTARMY
jgi:hypothetical protein